MRKLTVILALLVLCTLAVHAVDCTDSDAEDDIEKSLDEKGSVTYGLTEKFDSCVSNIDGYQLSTSRFVREYYCSNVSGNVQRVSKDYDCERYGFTRCEEGRCVGKNTTATYGSTTSTTTAGPLCGNHKIDAGENCDPPDKICYDADSNIGVCTRPNAQGFGGCQCKTLGSTSTTTPTTTTTVVQNVTVQKNETVTQPKEEPKVEPKEEPKEEPVKETETTSEEERAPLPVDFDDSKGISVTRGITNSVKRFFKWIGSWFG